MALRDGRGTQHLTQSPPLPADNRGPRRPLLQGRFLPVNMRDRPQVQGHYRQPKPAKQPLQRAEGINDLSCKGQRSVSSIGMMEFQSYRGQWSHTLGVCGRTTRSANTAGGRASSPRGAEQILDTHPRSLGLCLDSSTITEGCQTQERTGGR